MDSKQPSPNELSYTELQLALLDKSIELRSKSKEAVNDNVFVNDGDKKASLTDATADIFRIAITMLRQANARDFFEGMAELNESVLEKANYSLDELIKYRKDLADQKISQDKNSLAREQQPKQFKLTQQHLDLIDIALEIKKKDLRLRDELEQDVIVSINDSVQFYDEIVEKAVNYVMGVARWVSTDIKGMKMNMDQILKSATDNPSSYSLEELLKSREEIAAKLKAEL